MEEFDPNKYQGTWFEIAKYPAFYEFTKCVISTADYRFNADGNYLNVMNTCYKPDRTTNSILGIANPTAEVGKFLLHFFPESNKPFPVNKNAIYNVLWTDYYNFAFVGNFEESFYILGRRKRLTLQERCFVLEMTRELGYDTSKLKFNV